MAEEKVKGRTASIVEFVLGALLVLSGFNVAKVNILNGFAFIAFGAFLIVCGLEWRVLLKERRIYLTFIGANAAATVSDLAQANNSSEKTVKDNLGLMIKKGMVRNLAINEQNGAIVSNSGMNGAKGPASSSAPAAPAASQAPEKVAMRCPGCGAPNEITKGETTACEYCGSPLSV